MPADKVLLLSRVPMFGDLAPEELKRLSDLLRTRTHEARQTVVRQGDPGGDIFIIVRGHLKVVSSDVEGRDTMLGIMGPGEVFGEVSLLDGSERSATVTALENCELLTIGRDHFLRFLTDSPEIAIKLLKVLADRLRRLTERSEDMAFLRVSARLAKRIARLADEYGEDDPQGTRISFRLSQQEMGDLIGATRESANKHIRLWEQQGLVSQDGGHLIVHDIEALRQLAGIDIF